MSCNTEELSVFLQKKTCTLVSAFMTNINERGDRNMQKYVDLGYKLLNINVRQIFFIERHVFDTHFRNQYAHLNVGTSTNSFELRSPEFPRIPSATCPEYFTLSTDVCSFIYNGHTYEYVVLGHITFVFFEKSSMYFNEFREQVTEFSVNTQYPSKDTLDYMFVQCHKTEWVAMAIGMDASFGSSSSSSSSSSSNTKDMYIWMDFGIRHMFPSDMTFDMEIYRLRDRILRSNVTHTQIYAPSCWNADGIYYQDIYSVVHWVFAGSVFGGTRDTLLEFARRTKKKCISIMSEKRRLMWEVNVWYMVLLNCRELFSLYHGDHNATILRGFLQ
jgi:hypothetical protein